MTTWETQAGSPIATSQLVANATKSSLLATKTFTLVTNGQPTKSVSACFSHFLERFLYDCRRSKTKDMKKPDLSAQWSTPTNTILCLYSNQPANEISSSGKLTNQIEIQAWPSQFGRINCKTVAFGSENYWMVLNEFTRHVGLDKQDQVEQNPLLCVSQKTG